MALETNYVYLVRAKDGRFVAGVGGCLRFANNRRSAKEFTSENAAVKALRMDVLSTKDQSEFEILEYGVVPTNVIHVKLTREDQLAICVKASKKKERAVHQRDGRYFITYLGYEYVPETSTVFDLVSINRSRGKQKLFITAEGLHWNTNNFCRPRPDTIYVHGEHNGEVVLELWKKGNASPKRVSKPKSTWRSGRSKVRKAGRRRR